MISCKKFAVLPSLIIAVSCQYRSAESYVKQGHDMGLAGSYQAAIKCYDKAIEIDPKYKDAYLDKGLCLEYSRRYDDAIKQYKTLLSLDSSNTVAIFSIGLCESKQDRFSEAIKYFNQALMSKGLSNPEDTTAQIMIEYSSNGIMQDEAKYNVEAAQIYYERGYAYLCTNQNSSAYRDFQKCINNNYNLGSSYYLLGQCWLRSKSKQARLEAYKAFRSGYAYGDSLSKVEMDKLGV